MHVEIDPDPAGQLARVEMLLAVVRDTLSSLRRVSTQLEREVSQLASHPAGPANPRIAQTLAALRAENEQLKEALEGRAVIEQAKGMLMMTQECDAEAAFDSLVALSRRQKRKVREVAADLVQATARGAPPRGVGPQRTLAGVPAAGAATSESREPAEPIVQDR